MPLPSELIERLADAGARRELGRWLDALAGARPFDELRVERGVWAPAWTGLTVVGTPTFLGSWTRSGDLVHVFTAIAASVANTTASTLGSTWLHNLPFTCAMRNFPTVDVLDGITPTFSKGWIQAGMTRLYTPTWTATNANKFMSAWYQTESA